MHLADLHFRTSKKNVQQLVHDSDLLEIEKMIRMDRIAFELITNYFTHYTHNNDSLPTVKNYLNDERDILEVELDSDSSGGWVDEAIKYVSKMHMRLDYAEFTRVRNSYIEFIVLRWKNFFGGNSKVYSEPNVYHKRKLMFLRKKFCNSVCDIVHIDSSRKNFEMYECKTTMQIFMSHLNDDENNYTNVKTKKSIGRAKRKQEYMMAFLNLISNYSDAKTWEVAYITLATRDEILFDKIGDIPIYTKEDFQENYPHIFMK